jgi:glucose-6-phosphate 1-dehydrogenase
VFVDERRVEAAWRVVDPILDDSTPLYHYEPGSWGPHEAGRILAEGTRWHNPSPGNTN